MLLHRSYQRISASAARPSSAAPIAAQRAAPRRSVRARASLQPAGPGKCKIGFVGIGIMGHAMVSNLLTAGYEVHVWNRSPDKAEALAEQGAQVCPSPAQVAAAADYTFAMLSDPEAAMAVASGADGVTAGMAPGKGYIDVSTIDAATAKTIAALVRGKGAAYLEAPVSGSKKPAQDGALIFLAAGDEQLFEAVAGPLGVMGKKSFFLGEVGHGANMKLVVNMILGTLCASLAEGMALAEKSGLKQSDLLECLGLGACANPVFAVKGPMMLAHQYPPAFPLKHQQKDLRLALEQGEQVKQPLPIAGAVNGHYAQACAQGKGDQDFSAVLEAVLSQAQQ